MHFWPLLKTRLYLDASSVSETTTTKIFYAIWWLPLFVHICSRNWQLKIVWIFLSSKRCILKLLMQITLIDTVVLQIILTICVDWMHEYVTKHCLLLWCHSGLFVDENLPISISDFHAWQTVFAVIVRLSLIHIWRCRRIERCRSRWSPYH